MDFSLSEEQQQVCDLARQILEDIATNERLKEIESKDPVFDEKLWSELAKANLGGVAIPEEFGGSGLPLAAAAAILEEIDVLNRARGVTIHTIAFGAESNLLMQLAERNGGQYRFVDRY